MKAFQNFLRPEQGESTFSPQFCQDISEKQVKVAFILVSKLLMVTM